MSYVTETFSAPASNFFTQDDVLIDGANKPLQNLEIDYDTNYKLKSSAIKLLSFENVLK